MKQRGLYQEVIFWTLFFSDLYFSVSLRLHGRENLSDIFKNYKPLSLDEYKPFITKLGTEEAQIQTEKLLNSLDKDLNELSDPTSYILSYLHVMITAVRNGDDNDDVDDFLLNRLEMLIRKYNELFDKN